MRERRLNRIDPLHNDVLIRAGSIIQHVAKRHPAELLCQTPAYLCQHAERCFMRKCRRQRMKGPVHQPADRNIAALYQIILHIFISADQPPYHVCDKQIRQEPCSYTDDRHDDAEQIGSTVHSGKFQYP